MSTSEYRSVDAESDLPVSAAELAALASQLFAASVRPGPDSPPQAAPVAPRGNVPDTTAAASAGTAAAGAANPFTPAAPVIAVDRRIRARADFACARGHSADGAGRAAGQRAGCDGGAVGRLHGRECARPVRGADLGHRADDSRRAGGSTSPFRSRRAARAGLAAGAPTIAELGWSERRPRRRWVTRRTTTS